MRSKPTPLEWLGLGVFMLWLAAHAFTLPYDASRLAEFVVR